MLARDLRRIAALVRARRPRFPVPPVGFEEGCDPCAYPHWDVFARLLPHAPGVDCEGQVWAAFRKVDGLSVEDVMAMDVPKEWRMS